MKEGLNRLNQEAVTMNYQPWSDGQRVKKNHRYVPTGKGRTGAGINEESQTVEALMEHES